MIGTSGATVLFVVNLLFASVLGISAGGLTCFVLRRPWGFKAAVIDSCTCCGYRIHRCLRRIGDRGCSWCLGVPSDTRPGHRSCKRRFKACRTAAASFPLALADGSSYLCVYRLRMRHRVHRNRWPQALRLLKDADKAIPIDVDEEPKETFWTRI